ncbi:spore coat polysaccharide biosynthesis protein SpsF [Desulfatibacillum alkenivorans DSM 16219]|jgi:glutamate-1-semialdehyde 2,1-aminomutase/spore coat polysaccharide biosynthesis protein SpsF|uniref:Spore coat polysaccharide biosynthesis protein SpsF n=1 Tax=Desulfatibacillum alkenivorans DSM 16219 TaxID=1121393 RepID=A0A1M6Y879_9BACT|nr:aminotransferase class III-fold pyridoxal phosphate-dependent enzyme [Desulfatibacillum alkenivorans]SHL14342.1 spore coat polysaccharide biosynthesis protein SpsF [Desulfatibacillum alkenivorans DSM 16219]
MILGVIQARMGSTRLPGKVLEDIAGKPMLLHVVNRLQSARLVDKTLVATSTRPGDDPVAELCSREKIPCFRGSEDDVLDRFYQAAKEHQASVVVRVTGDCPCLDPSVVDKVAAAYQQSKCDYAANILVYTYPDGLDVEVFSMEALETAWKTATLPGDREHVTPFIRNSPDFSRVNVENETELAYKDLRLTVDEPQDLEFVRELYARLGASGFGLEQVLDLLQKEPQLIDINAGKIRNEGFYKTLVKEDPMPGEKLVLDKSEAMLEQAKKLIPSASQTFSKCPTQFVRGAAPVFLQKGKGSHVWDVDGNEFIDFPMALGPIILGHNYPEVTEAATAQAREGIAFSLPHPLEVEVAQMLTEIIPCAEMVRFGKNGSDVTAGAVRAARAYTNRDMIAFCGYHGWQDWYIGTTTRNRGVPETTAALSKGFAYNDLDSLKSLFEKFPGKIAAVIMEPVGVVRPYEGYLQDVKNLAHENGALLIFDEVITGFRLALGGAQEYFGVTPDLACVGKAMANGFPISAVVGRRPVMELFDEIFFSFTFGGEAVSLAAAKATIEVIRSKNIFPHLWELGGILMDGATVLAREFGLEDHINCIGYEPRSLMTFKEKSGEESLLLKSLFQQECLKRGVLFSGGQNMCFSHTHADIEHTLRAYRAAMEILAKAIDKNDVEERLEGKPVEPVFRKA